MRKLYLIVGSLLFVIGATVITVIHAVVHLIRAASYFGKLKKS